MLKLPPLTSLLPKRNPRDAHRGEPAPLSSPERRSFLRLGLEVTGIYFGGAVLSVVAVKEGRCNAENPGIVGTFPYDPHYAMVVRQDRCLGCNDCVAACRRANRVPAPGYRIAVQKRVAPAGVSGGGEEYRPVLCNQCNRPPCVKVCPTKATYKDTENGIVMIDDKLCIGCMACQVSCPYNARFYNQEKGAIDKCDFCYRVRLRKSNSLPACVEACPNKVFIFGNLAAEDSQVRHIVYETGKTLLVLRPKLGTMPNVFYLRD